MSTSITSSSHPLEDLYSSKVSHPASPDTLLPLYNKPAEEVLQFGLLLLLLFPLFSLLVMMLLLMPLLLLVLFWMPKTVQSLLFLHPPSNNCHNDIHDDMIMNSIMHDP